MDTINILITAFVIITTHLLTKIRSIDIRISIGSDNSYRSDEPEIFEAVGVLPEDS